MVLTDRGIEGAYRIAKERYAEVGTDVEAVFDTLNAIPVSIQCWQGNDVVGFESRNGTLTGGIQTTGNYIGRASDAPELRSDLQMALSLIPGENRVNMHVIYLESNKQIERDQIRPCGWIEWAKQNDLGLDFNPTCFSHPNSLPLKTNSTLLGDWL